jgi:pyruvate/2-oxoglutarate/acetoin dehydrogenase E1 component
LTTSDEEDSTSPGTSTKDGNDPAGMRKMPPPCPNVIYGRLQWGADVPARSATTISTRDPNVFLIGEDIAVYGGALKVTAGFLEKFSERRVVETPISESAIVGASIGAGLMGLRPVAEMQFSDFITSAFDQIVNFAAKCRYRWNAPVPMVIRAPSGGGIHGGPYHSQNPEMWFVRTPGLKVVAPATA